MIASIVAAVLLPPFCLILIGLAGVAVWRRRPRLGRALAGASLALLWLVSTTAFNAPLLEALRWQEPVDFRAGRDAQAIVVLGGGLSTQAVEYGGADTVNSRTLERMRYAAWLSRQTGLPILASGGPYGGGAVAEATLMKQVLEQEFATPVRWIETQSRNTLENARASAVILREAGIGKVYLVTHSAHMRRAVQAFAPTRIEVVPAAIGIFTRDAVTYVDFLPGPVGFQTGYAVAHEVLGRAWYSIRLWLDQGRN